MKVTWALFLLAIYSLTVPVLAQNRSLDENISAHSPGDARSVSFMVHNPTDQIRNFLTSVQTSDSLIVSLLKEERITLPPNDSVLLIIPLLIHPKASPGEKTVSISTLDPQVGHSLTYTSKIWVSRVRGITMTALNSKIFAKAGETVSSTVLIKNVGNSQEQLFLSSRSKIQPPETGLLLNAGEEMTVVISHQTDPGEGRILSYNLDLSVRTADPDAHPYIFSEMVTVIPVKAKQEDIYLRFPISASISFLGMKNQGKMENGFQGEIYGRGTLGKMGKDELEFRAITKNPIQFSSFSQYEEYFMNYSRKNLYVHLGDKVFSSSFLTEFARYGRGAEIRVDMGKLSIGGFYNRPRFFREIDSELNLRTTLKVDSNTKFTAGYLYKQPLNGYDRQGSPYYPFPYSSHLPYLIGQTRMFGLLDVHGEFSLSKSGYEIGRGYRIEAKGDFSNFHANFAFMHSSPRFAGYFTNTTMVNGNFRYAFLKRLELLGNINRDARNFQRDTLLFAAPYRNSMQYGLNYRYHHTGNILIFNGYQRYLDRFTPQQFNYEEIFFRISLNQKIADLQVDLEAQLGNTNNLIAGFSGRSNYYTANFSIDRFNTLFSMFGSFAKTSRYQEMDQGQFYYGGRIISRLSPKSSLSAFFQNNFMPEEYYRDRNQFELSFRQKVSSVHSFQLSGRYLLQRGSLGQRDFILSLRYTMQLGLPVRKVASYSSLSGNVRNLGVESTQGIRLKLGSNVSLTDEFGNYTFKNIPPGDYMLEVDRSAMSLEDITDVPIPIQLKIEKDGGNSFNFGITKASRITGKVSLTQQREEKDSTEGPIVGKKPQKNSLIIEITNGSQIYRKKCDIGSEFDFTYLRPGKWTLRVYLGNLEKQYQLAKDIFEMELKPGEEKELGIIVSKRQFEIHQQKQTIKISYKGEVK